MRIGLLSVMAGVLALAGVAAAQTTTEGTTTTTTTTTPAAPPADMPLQRFRERRVALRHTVTRIKARKFRGPAHPFRRLHREILPHRRAENLAYWRGRVSYARSLSKHPLVVRAMRWYYASGAECVHGREGAWNDPNAPYWGGMQADLSFQRTYGPEFLRRWGTADRWPAWAQIVMAYRAHALRGWSPWPTTARDCGLL